MRKSILPIILGLGVVLLAVILLVLLNLKPRLDNTPSENEQAATQVPVAVDKQTSRIVYTSTQGGTANIFLYDLEDGSSTQLTNSAGENWSPAWSSDGKVILFTSNRDGNSEIYAMFADGSGQVNLTRNPGEDAFPDMSTDMTKIVFESMRDGNNEIYVMNADGSGQTRLTNYSDLDGLPSWSPDGRKIAFTRAQDGNTDIYLMKADGSGLQNLTNHTANDNSAIWSPDGSLIGFDSNRDGKWEFYTMNTDGSNPARITENNGYYGYADWAPEREYITYTADNNGDLNIGVMTTGGAVVTMLVNSPVAEIDSSWSPGYVPGIHADSVLPPTPYGDKSPGLLETPQQGYTPVLLPTSTGSAPVNPAACGVQNGDWSAWAGTELNLILTITDCKITVVFIMGTINGEWVILSHNLDQTITGSDFDYVHAFDSENQYQLSGTFTSSTTAQMQLVFRAPFKFSDTSRITQDLEFDMTASVE